MTTHRQIVNAWAGWHTQGRPSTMRLRFLFAGMFVGFIAGYFAK